MFIFEESPLELHNAIQRNSFNRIVELIESGYCLDERDIHGLTPLMLCAFYSDEKKAVGLVQALMQRGATLSMTDKQGLNALHHACIQGKSLVVNVLLESLDDDIMVGCRKGNSALHYAVMANNTKLLETLIDYTDRYKIATDKPNKVGLTPLQLARKLKLTSMANLLSKKMISSRADTLFGSNLNVLPPSIRGSAPPLLESSSHVSITRSKYVKTKKGASHSQTSASLWPLVPISTLRSYLPRSKTEYHNHKMAVAVKLPRLDTPSTWRGEFNFI